MNLSPAKLSVPFVRRVRRAVAGSDPGAAPAGTAPAPAAEPADEARSVAEAADPGWRSSSYDLKHGLDVVELPTTLPPDVLDRLFSALAK
jgi:hypothetical protein